MRAVKRLLQVVAFLLTLVVGAAAAVLIVSQTTWFKNWLRGYIVSEANQYLNGQLTIERLSGNLFFGVELEGIGLTMDGAEVLSVQDLGLDYSVFDFISKGMTIDDIRLNKPILHLRRHGDEWSIARLIKKQASEADRQGPAPPIDVGKIGITDGSILIDRPVGTSGVNVPERFDRLDARLSFKYEPVHYSVDIGHLSFRSAEPSFGVNALSGGFAVRDDALYVDKLAIRTEETSLSVDGAIRDYLGSPKLNLRVSSDKLSLPELARLLPALEGVRLQPAFEVNAEGPLDHLAVGMNVRSSAGQLTGQFVADVTTPQQSVAGDFTIRHVNLAPIMGDASKASDLTADAHVDVRAPDFGDVKSLRGSISLRSPRIAAMGYAAEQVKAALRLNGTSVDLDAAATAYGTAATATGRVGLPIDGASLTYDLRGRARRINLKQMPASFRLPPAETDINAEYHVHGSEPVLAAARHPRQVSAELRFDGTRVAGAAIVAGSTAQLSLDRDEVAFNVDASIAELNLQQVGNDFKLGALASDRYEGQLGGHVSAEGRIGGITAGPTLDTVSATVRASLDPSRVGTLAIDSASVDADYHDRAADIRELSVVARDLNVKATGTAALDATGHSNLTFRADTPHLEEVARLVDLDLSGIASIDGTLEGNIAELRAKGHLTGNGVNYGADGALALSSDFDVRVPDLSLEQARVTADTHATFVMVGGQNINDLTAQTTYADKQLQFDATAKQPERSVAAAGSAAFHADHQEVHLERLLLQTQGLEWQLAAGSEAAIRYGNQAVEVKDVRLVSGDQVITADGTVGQAGSALGFTLTNIDLASVDALLMRPPQFSGRLTVSGRVEGTPGEPQVFADFQVNDGGFREFKYQTLSGKLGYAPPEVTVDARLQQTATQWLTVKGTLPASLPNRSTSAAEEPATMPEPGPIDLTIDSSPIDLGLVQGFTTALTKVTGTLEAHLRVTGSVDDPQPAGALIVRDGAAMVEATGVAYKNIAARIDLQPDRIHIDQITVLDNHDSALSVTGDLAIRERQLGDVQLYVTARDFKVIDNKMGNVRVESSLEVNGELRAPRIGGYLGVSTGQVNLDEIVARVGPSPYSTSQTEFVTEAAAASAETTPAPGVFDALKMDVSLYVPNDLVVRSSSLETPGAPVSLGALNVTFGGDVRAVKEQMGQPQLYGSITTIRGTYDFQGRRFEILRDGSIRFDGVDMLNPRLDIRTRRIIQAVEAFVNIRGTLKQPEIALTSNPPLEEADILSLVVFNQQLNQLGEGQQISLAARAQALAAGAVANQLAQSIGGALHLDTFEIELAPDNKSDALVTIGQQVGRNLYVKVQQAIGDQGLTNFILEYEINRWLRLQSNVLTGSTVQQAVFRRLPDTGVDVLYFFSF